MPYTQENRFLKINTRLGENVLLLERISGTEKVSSLFSFEIDLASHSNSIVFKDIIGQSVTVTIALENGETRYINGIISRFSQEDNSNAEEGDTHLSYYSATMLPWFWLLTRTKDSRIFQSMSVPDIVEKIFTEKSLQDYKIQLHGSYEKRDYCVQYRETDFNFVSRLLEEEGIYYFFEHENGKHTLVMADVPEEHKPCPHQETARYHSVSGAELEDYVITRLEVRQEIRSGKYTLNDFNFETPTTDLKVEVPGQQATGPGEREIYDYPGGFGKRTDGDRLANIRMQEEEAAIISISGAGACRAFTSGYKFTLKDYYRDDMNDKNYVLLSVSHTASQRFTPDESEEEAYSNSFTCIPFDVPYRPRRTARKPVVEGVQTAIVVGPSGEDIYTDEYGRVKVQFHWDREGQKDDKSSCWMRVSQVWAGGGWGAMHVPHVGHEVIVNFIEGNPDRPIITGRVYHGANKPPDELPANKTKNYIQSWGDNDIIFENKDGDKQIHIKQACGNEIRMHESTPDIEIKQECGNEILMHAAEGIQIRDKFGNEIIMDAVAGTMRLRSPSHESVIDLGKSVYVGTFSDLKYDVGMNANFIVHGYKDEYVVGPLRLKYDGICAKMHGGIVSDTYGGGKNTNFVGVSLDTYLAAKWTFAHSYEYKRTSGKIIVKGSSSTWQDMKADVKIDSGVKTEVIGGGGDSDTSKMTLTGSIIKIKSGDGSDGSFIEINADSDIEIKSKANVIIDAPDGEIVLSSSSGKPIKFKTEKLDIKGKIKHKYIKVD